MEQSTHEGFAGSAQGTSIYATETGQQNSGSGQADSAVDHHESSRATKASADSSPSARHAHKEQSRGVQQQASGEQAENRSPVVLTRNQWIHEIESTTGQRQLQQCRTQHFIHRVHRFPPPTVPGRPDVQVQASRDLLERASQAAAAAQLLASQPRELSSSQLYGSSPDQTATSMPRIANPGEEGYGEDPDLPKMETGTISPSREMLNELQEAAKVDTTSCTVETSSRQVAASHDMAKDSVVIASSPEDHETPSAAAGSAPDTARSSEESGGTPKVLTRRRIP